MEGLDIASMLEDTSLTVFYPEGELGCAVVISHEEEVIDVDCMSKEAFLHRWGKKVNSDMIGPNSCLVRYKWIRQGTESLRVEDVRVLVLHP